MQEWRPTQEDQDAAKPDISYADYCRGAWNVVEPNYEYIHNWHIDCLGEHLEAVSRGELRFLLINMPPGCMKSLNVSVFWPTWEWTWKPWTRWLTTSYDLRLATRDTLKSRDVIHSPWYRERWGHVYHLSGDQNQKQSYKNNRTGYRLIASPNAGATGEGGNRILCDDPHPAGKKSESAATRTATVEWWKNTMRSRGRTKDAAFVVCQQRTHQHDVAGWIIEESPDPYYHLVFPMEFETGMKKDFVLNAWPGRRVQDPRTEPGELLWEKRFDATEVSALKVSLGSYQAAGQLQQRPSPSEGGMFKRWWWRFWHTPGQPLPPVIVRRADGSTYLCPCEPLPPIRSLQQLLQSWDMAFKDVQEAVTDPSYVVGQVWGRLHADRYLLDQYRRRASFLETIGALLDLTRKWPQAKTKLVEDKANGPAVLSTLRRRVSGLLKVQVKGDKEARAVAHSPTVEAGNVYLPHPKLAPWVEDFIAEFVVFPNGKDGDQVDSFSQAMDRYDAGPDLAGAAAALAKLNNKL